MIGPSQTVKKRFEPGLQLFLIVSVLMHILVIAFVTDPFYARKKLDDSYFVNLVMSANINRQPHAALSKKELVKEKSVVNVIPKKKQKSAVKPVKASSPEVSVKPIEKKSIKKSFIAEKKSSKPVRPLVKSRSTSGKEYAIERKMPGNKEKFNGDTLTMDRTGRESKFAVQNDMARQGKAIEGKSISDMTGYTSIAKGLRAQAFASGTDTYNEQHLIEKKSRVVKEETIPVEKAFRDAMFAAAGQREAVDKTGYEISEVAGAVKNEIFPEEETVKLPETDFSSKAGIASLTEHERMPAIARPAAQVESSINKSSLQAEKEQLINNTVIDDKGREKSNISPEVSIQAVPLDELNACANALDERTLKKKILHIVGDKKECYNNHVGKYIFMGTARFASFDMNILPSAGRKLSNRCEELRNAFQCLTIK